MCPSKQEMTNEHIRARMKPRRAWDQSRAGFSQMNQESQLGVRDQVAAEAGMRKKEGQTTWGRHKQVREGRGTPLK